MITKEDILKVKELANIEDVISNTGVTLKKSGINSLKGLCPFHSEGTPSFHVRPNHGTFTCFGCGKRGDVISFIQEKENMTFTEAVRFVADLYSIEIVEEIDQEEAESGVSRKRLLEVNKEFGQWLRNNYDTLPTAHPARTELAKRDLGMFAASCGVGYAPEGWQNAREHLASKGFTDDDMIAAGIASQNEEGRVYDAFRGRVTWEIKDVLGRIIGFGARRIFEADRGPKYLNTPETVLYKKSNVLYGIDLARQASAKTSVMYVVEGYTDVMAFRAAGVYNVVASCGTAFGDTHASIVRRIVGDKGSIIFCFDGDAAGLAAARKTFEIKTPIHNSAFAVSFDEGDPCDVRIAGGNQALLDAIETKKPLTEFVLRHELGQHDMSSPEGRSAYLQDIAPVLLQISDPVLRSEYVSKVTLWAGTTLDNARATLNRSARNTKPAPLVTGGEDNAPSTPSVPELVVAQHRLLALIIQFPDIAQSALPPRVTPAFFDPGERGIAAEVLHLLQVGTHALQNSKPDVFSDSDLAHELMNMPFPALERSPQSHERVVAHSIRGTVGLIETLRKRAKAATLKASISSILTGNESEDLKLLEKIGSAQDALRPQSTHLA